MPYIKPEDRKTLEIGIPENPGELNYVLTREIMEYVDEHAPLSYQLINDVLGALEGAKQEFYRRVAAPYEDQKMRLNGDVY